jgi:hypothetical protein
MPREKHDFTAFEFADNVVIGGIAKRRFDHYFAVAFETGHRVQTTPADDAD